MRVIAGVAKGRRLRAPAGLATRPMTDRAREAVFSAIAASIPGARVLDLYAGTGSLGLEALSRGAASATFVERDRSAVTALQVNVGMVGLGGRCPPTWPGSWHGPPPEPSATERAHTTWCLLTPLTVTR